MTVLRVRDLTVTLPTPAGALLAAERVAFDLVAGQTLGLVGESGAGKTTVLWALLGLLPRGATVAGSVRLGGRELVGLPDRELAALRGRQVGMVFQDPAAALDPIRRVGGQVAEGPRALLGWSRAMARDRTLELLRLMEVADPEQVARRYPHQLSGGIRQRVLIAAALACEPAVLLCDEPTSALDATTREHTLELLRTAARRVGAALLLVSHDLTVVGRLCGTVLVMYAGRVVEHGPAGQVFADPRHPYTRALLRSAPVAGTRPAPIPGEPPGRSRPPSGCRFRTRCDLAEPRCASLPPEPTPVGPLRAAACVHAAAPLPEAPRGTPTAGRVGAPAKAGPPVLQVRGLTVEFRPGLRVLDGVDLHLGRGEILGLVGESGCGKTTLGRCLVGLRQPTAGEILLDGRPASGPRTAADRRRIQLVFQDPAAALNPARRIGGMLAELLRVHGLASRSEVRQRCVELLRSVGLDANLLGALPHTLSGGQQQRVGLARALALRPDVIVADEVVSALDVSVQASVLDLLVELRDRLGVAVLFISHDLAVIRQVCDRVAVLHRGRIVELAEVEDVFASPRHPYTRRLLAAVPMA